MNGFSELLELLERSHEGDTSVRPRLHAALLERYDGEYARIVASAQEQGNENGKSVGVAVAIELLALFERMRQRPPARWGRRWRSLTNVWVPGIGEYVGPFTTIDIDDLTLDQLLGGFEDPSAPEVTSRAVVTYVAHPQVRGSENGSLHRRRR